MKQATEGKDLAGDLDMRLGVILYENFYRSKSDVYIPIGWIVQF